MALSDYLASMGIDKALLEESMLSMMPSKFFNNSMVTRETIVIPKSTATSKYYVLRLGNNKHIKGIKELKYRPLQSCNDILIDMNTDIRDI